MSCASISPKCIDCTMHWDREEVKHELCSDLPKCTDCTVHWGKEEVRLELCTDFTKMHQLRHALG